MAKRNRPLPPSEKRSPALSALAGDSSETAPYAPSLGPSSATNATVPDYGADKIPPIPRELRPPPPVNWERVTAICAVATIGISLVVGIGWAIIDYTQFRTNFGIVQSDVKELKERFDRLFQAVSRT